MKLLMLLTHSAQSSKVETVDARLVNWPFWVFDFRAPWAPECPKVKSSKWSVSQPGVESLNYIVAIFGNTKLKWVNWRQVYFAWRDWRLVDVRGCTRWSRSVEECRCSRQPRRRWVFSLTSSCRCAWGWAAAAIALVNTACYLLASIIDNRHGWVNVRLTSFTALRCVALRCVSQRLAVCGKNDATFRVMPHRNARPHPVCTNLKAATHGPTRQADMMGDHVGCCFWRLTMSTDKVLYW